jgi:enamine deaminase RidA (YjgF/YER057c/UK114 family)
MSNGATGLDARLRAHPAQAAGAPTRLPCARATWSSCRDRCRRTRAPARWWWTACAEQTRAVVAERGRVLAAAGASLDDVVVAVTAYLADIDDWDEFNDAYRELFRPPYPTRTTVGAGTARLPRGNEHDRCRTLRRSAQRRSSTVPSATSSPGSGRHQPHPGSNSMTTVEPRWNAMISSPCRTVMGGS